MAHPDEDGNGGEAVERQLCHGCHGDGRIMQSGLLGRDEDEEYYQRDDGQDHDEDARKETSIGMCTVYAVVVRRALGRMLGTVMVAAVLMHVTVGSKSV